MGGASMQTRRRTPEEIARRGQAIYDQRIRPQVEATDRGKYLVLDVDSGDYEIDEDHIVASDRAAARHPGGTLYGVRIGYPVLGHIGGAGRPELAQ